MRASVRVPCETIANGSGYEGIPMKHSRETASDRLLQTIDDVARELNIGRTTVYVLIRTKELEAVKIGRSTRIPRASVRALIERLRHANTA